MPVAVPQWDLADRMRKALREADIGVQEMADYLGVARNTVSTWINGRIIPGAQTQRLWALRCGVPYEWIRDGLPRLDSNQEPAGFAKLLVVRARPFTRFDHVSQRVAA